MLSIDEAIEDLKYDIEIDMYIRNIAPQIAEWLEELKALREKNETLKALYDDAKKEGNNLLKHERNKALDDFVKFANTMPTVETEDGEIRPMWLEEMAEQLKAGESE